MSSWNAMSPEGKDTILRVVRSEAEKASRKAKATAKKQPPSTVKRRPGRPKGSTPPPKLPCPSRRSDRASQGCSLPCCT